jgi:hypothetical protein
MNDVDALMDDLQDERGIPAPPRVPNAEAVWAPADTQGDFALNPDSENMQLTFRCRFGIKPDVLRGAMEELSQRHDVLRTRYLTDANGRVWAATEKQVTPPLRVVDVRPLEPGARDAAIDDATASAVRESFDPLQAPLWRVTAILSGDHEALLIATFHHSIYDRASLVIFSADLGMLYSAHDAGRPSTLPALPAKYRDFARRQHEYRASGEMEVHLDYWRRKLAGASHMFWLPVDRRSPVGDTRNLPQVSGFLAGDSVPYLRELAAREQTSMFAIVATAFAVLLALWSSRYDVLTWICHSARGREGFERVIGCFTDMWLLRADLSGDPDFSEAMRRVQAAYVEALVHTQVTAAALRADVARIRGARRHFPSVVLNFVPYRPTPRPGAMQLGDTAVAMPAGVGRLDRRAPTAFIITFFETQHELYWYIRHQSHLFEEATIERVSTALGQILATAARRPGQRLSELPLESLSAAGIANCKVAKR